jgi:hypothetical protein
LKGYIFIAEVLIYSVFPAPRLRRGPREPAHAASRRNASAGFDERGFDDTEAEMRGTLVALSTVAALIAGSLLFGSNRADAMIAAAPLGHAGQSISPDY